MRRAILCLAVLATACGADTDEAIDPVGTPVTPTQACEDWTPPALEGADDTTTKPDIQIPDRSPSCELVVHDLVEGTGAEAPPGGTVTAHYVGVSWSTGEQFDASWDRGEAATFPLDQVIQGWAEGIPGMKEGGRRQLIIPPDLGYGPQPPPGSAIAPNETLVFVVDLIEVE